MDFELSYAKVGIVAVFICHTIRMHVSVNFYSRGKRLAKCVKAAIRFCKTIAEGRRSHGLNSIFNIIIVGVFITRLRDTEALLFI